MNTNRKAAGTTASVPRGLALAALVSMITTLVSAAIIAHCIHSERISWEQAGCWIMGMLFAASFLGGKSAYAAIRRQRLIVCFMAGILYWGLLLVTTALFFGGDYSTVWETAGIICGGSGAAGLLSVPDHHKKKAKVGRGNR